MSQEYLAEAIGSLIFFATVLSTNDPWIVGIGLMIGIIIAQKLSARGHLNPGVTTMMVANGTIDKGTASRYIIAQLIGAIAAVYLVKRVSKKN
jgi:glycerol uptake facilitator-like aquaporin